MGSNRRMDHMTWPEFKEAKARPVIVPIGSTEQHGQQEAQHHDDQHVEHGEDHGVPQGDAEGGITENDLVVFQPGKVERPEAVPAQRCTFPPIICLPCLCASFRWALWIA